MFLGTLKMEELYNSALPLANARRITEMPAQSWFLQQSTYEISLMTNGWIKEISTHSGVLSSHKEEKSFAVGRKMGRIGVHVM